jgi:hypothetical protein
VKFQIVEPPIVSTAPVWPRRTLFLVGVLLGALAAGVVLVNRLDRLRPLVGSASGLAKLTGVPVLAAVGAAFPERARRVRRRQILNLSAAVACLLIAFGGVLMLSHKGARLHLPPSLQHLV